MEKTNNYEVQFVGYMPDEFKQGILYVSMRGKIVIHLCACGCSEKVVTPISPNDWKLTFDGETISLYPSIGNWDFPCKSHYFIRNNRSVFVQDWEEKTISEKEKKSKKKKRFFRFLGEIKFTGINSPILLRLKANFEVISKRVTSKATVSATSKVLRDERTSPTSKTAARSVLPQEEKVDRENKQQDERA